MFRCGTVEKPLAIPVHGWCYENMARDGSKTGIHGTKGTGFDYDRPCYLNGFLTGERVLVLLFFVPMHNGSNRGSIIVGKDLVSCRC